MKKRKKRPQRGNKFEKRIGSQLKRRKASYKYEGEKIPYVLTGNYIPDYVVYTTEGTIYIEAKGYFRPEHKRKMAAVRRQHPELDIRIVFYKERQADIRWCEKLGFPYAFGKIPKEWLNGFT